MDAPLWVDAGQTCSWQKAGCLSGTGLGGDVEMPGTVLPSLGSPLPVIQPLPVARPAHGPPLSTGAGGEAGQQDCRTEGGYVTEPRLAQCQGLHKSKGDRCLSINSSGQKENFLSFL